MPIIQILTQTLADRIAAGEVIERPASVVKELIENSIDAGSNHISIEITGGGIESIKVCDDGCGMDRQDALLAFERHATSKIKTDNDLFNIATLGFRGEALPSIGSVAQVELTTKTNKDSLGTKLRISGGKIDFIREVGCNTGTEIVVSNIFYNTPARLKYLKKPAQEISYIVDVITRIAIAYPHIYFTLVSDGKIKFKSPSCSNLENRLIDIYGVKTIEKMLPVKKSNSEMSLDGLISKPELSRGNRHHQTFLVNGRWIKSSLLTAAVDYAYKSLLPSGRFPVLVINIKMPPDSIDVNVHPTKTEIRLPNEPVIFSFVSSTIKETLSKSMLSPIIEIGKNTLIKPSDLNNAFFSNIESDNRGQVLNIKNRESQELPLNLIEKVQESVKTGEYYQQKREKISLNPLLQLMPKGQVFNTYIIAEGPDGIYIVDQHAAHERVLFEKLLKNTDMANCAQILLKPAVIEVTPLEKQFITDNLSVFNEIGFHIEDFGTNSVLIRTVPMIFKKTLDEKTLISFLDEMVNSRNLTLPGDSKRKAIIVSACKAAIKANDRLSYNEMGQLLKDLVKTENPFTCPHGRPTIITITHSELKNKFYRT